MRRLPIGASGVTDQPRLVGLVEGSVVARFVEASDARKQAQGSANALGQQHCVLAVDVAGDIDRAALRGRLLNVAVSSQQAARDEQAPGSVVRFGEQAVVVCSLAAIAGAEFSGVGRGAHGDHADHAADGAGTVEIAGAAAHQFDAPKGQFGLLLPVNPSAYGVVQRDIVLGEQGAAGGGGTQAAQADSLRGGVCHQRTGTAEEFDTGKLAKLAVQSDGRGCFERLLGE